MLEFERDLALARTLIARELAERGGRYEAERFLSGLVRWLPVPAEEIFCTPFRPVRDGSADPCALPTLERPIPSATRPDVFRALCLPTELRSTSDDDAAAASTSISVCSPLADMEDCR